MKENEEKVEEVKQDSTIKHEEVKAPPGLDTPTDEKTDEEEEC